MLSQEPAKTAALAQIEPVARASISDRVFDALYRQVLSLDLPPGAKLSEADVSRQMGVSRQPVRDAFYRLSKLGFLIIQPQRATTVSQISARDVFRARFIRTAIEVEIVRRACESLDPSGIAVLERLIEQQQEAIDAGDKRLFHQLDDAFHREVCALIGLGFSWDVIRENKAHTDRVRFLSLAFASQTACDDHRRILDALKARDKDAGEAAVRQHLSRIEGIVERLRADNHAWFAEEE
ncbi:GntR family transcriptional regulator [Oceaniglobus roseus]|uniref:GntR family transcriptional regulator n=1 Tax=Oceaniglobus roseus TaxID=1737570 RepID=UPI000C7EB0DA|nr:GntR family transcriptional regulator [Kandeliimicrobium roseum]